MTQASSTARLFMFRVARLEPKLPFLSRRAEEQHMFDTSKIGHSFAPFTVEVYRNKIHELTAAIGDNNPVYHSREAAQAAGFPDVPISPTTPTIFNFWGARQREGNSLAS